MISKRKRNTILIYCMASMIMLCAFASNVTDVTTKFKTNSKRVVAENNYVETDEISYGLVAIEASSCIEENKDAQNVTEIKKEEQKEEVKEEKKEERKEQSDTKTSENKSSTVKNAKTAQSKEKKKVATKKTSSNKTKTTKTKKAKNSTTNTKASVPSNKSLGTKIASYAKQFVGNPYRLGGTSLTHGTDCSGFTQSVFKHFGIKLPRTASAQARVGVKVSFNKLEAGDLLFYSNGGSKISHVAIYIGNGKIVHAQTPRLGIGITTANIMTKVTARRVVK